MAAGPPDLFVLPCKLASCGRTQVPLLQMSVVGMWEEGTARYDCVRHQEEAESW